MLKKAEGIMKILQLCEDIFDELPGNTDIKSFFHHMRIKENSKKNNDDNTDRGFFRFCSCYLGGREYNEFLDFSLFAIKLNAIYNKHCYLEQGCS